MSFILLNNAENFDGIVDKVSTDSSSKRIDIHVKQWNNSKDYCLSKLKFENVVFHSFEDVSDFHLVNTIRSITSFKNILEELKKNITSTCSSNKSIELKNILNSIEKNNKLNLYLLESDFFCNWLIICQSLKVSEFEKSL